MRFFSRILLIFTACCLILSDVSAATIKIAVNSGTGFFVSRNGYLITNLHVVQQCRRIVILGAVHPSLAKVIARDVRHDLALLKVDTLSVDPAYLRDLNMPVKKGERVVIVGYPGDAWRTQKTVTREAEVINEKGPRGEDTWLQLSDRVEQGNSGGPLIDSYGNVIGVIVAKAVIYTYEKSAPQNGTYSNSGVAIALPVIRKFLDDYQVPYAFSDARSSLSTDRITDQSNHYIVNVRCETPTEVR